MEIETRDTVGKYLNYKGLTGLGAEIGVAYGCNAKNILDHWQGFGLFLIDPYDKNRCGKYVDPTASIDFDRAMQYMLNLLEKHKARTILIRQNSDTAYQLLKGIQLDFVYIDGNHTDPYVSRDIENYWNVVKPGGILGGHDYTLPSTKDYKYDVHSAVDNFVGKTPHKKFTTTKECDSWWIEK